jgi:hypothetical protein
MHRKDILERKEEILNWISNHEPKVYICKQLKCKPDTLETYLKKMNISYVGNQGSKGKKIDWKYVDALTYAKKDNVSAHKLRIKLLRDKIKIHCCEVCNTSEWMGCPIPLELDHIDGNHYNNDLTNLRIICPNCHAQTDTHAGKNRNKLTRITN